MINFKLGDATQPKGIGNKVIVHCCNNQGGWGRGFVVALSKRWREPELQYREWFRNRVDFGLGAVQFVQVQHDIWVANLIGQHGIRSERDADREMRPPIRYNAIAMGLRQIKKFCNEHEASVHMPRMGSGLAGGKWSVIEQLVLENLEGVPVTVYDLPIED